MSGEDKDCGVQQLWPESLFYPSQLGDLGLGLRLSLWKMVPTQGCSKDAGSVGPGAVAVAVLILPMLCVLVFFCKYKPRRC